MPYNILGIFSDRRNIHPKQLAKHHVPDGIKRNRNRTDPNTQYHGQHEYYAKRDTASKGIIFDVNG